MSQQPYSGRGAGGTTLLTLISAALFLYVGFVLSTANDINASSNRPFGSGTAPNLI